MAINREPISVATSVADDPAAVAHALRAELPHRDYALVLVLFAPTYDAENMAARLPPSSVRRLWSAVQPRAH